MCSLYTCMSLGNRSCENIGNMHLFPTEVAKREAVVLPGARWAWMGPVVKCCSQTQHRLQMCFRSTCAKCISVHLEGSWYWACRQITTQDKGHKVHGCLPRCVIFQISIQEPPHISVAENPTPQCGLLERWHVLFTSQPVFFYFSSVLLAVDGLQLWLWPARYLHQSLHHFQAEHAESAVQRIGQPAASEEHRLQVNPAHPGRPCRAC